MSSPPPAANDTTPPSPMNNNATSPPPTFSAVTPPPPVGNGSVSPNSPPPRPPNNTTLVALGIGVGLGGTIVLIAVGIFVFLYRRRKRRQALTGSSMRPPEDPKEELFGGPYQRWQQNAPPPQSSSMSSGLSSEKTIFVYEELARATDNFSNSNLLGQGGFGYVHKGVLPGGKDVAIKQLKVGSGQGEREFQAEVETISRVHHKHLVSLVGYCSSGAKRLLVYEFVPNSTLEFHLHGKGQPPLNWATRMKIALGSARGLAYLHEDCNPRIIHRDIKASNILLDNDFEAKVADFGLARLTFDTDTHISTRVMGTFGYLAPEYALTGKLTDKSDVFSFGVVLLELITGRRPIDKGQFFLDDNIVDWARPLLTQALEDGNFDTIVDQRLQQDYDSTALVRMVACAAACVRHLARLRPRMSQVVRALEGNLSLDELNEGIRPGHSTVYSLDGSSDYDTAQYKEDLQRFQKMAFETQVQNPSDECSGPTSEFGVPPSASSSEGLQTTRDLGSSSEVQQSTNEGEVRRNIPVE